MTTADVLTMALAGFAVVFAGWVVVHQIRSRRAGGAAAGVAGEAAAGADADATATSAPRADRRAAPSGPREWPPRPPTLPQRPRTAAVSVLLVDRRDGTTVWRIGSTTDARCTIVDVFSYRHESTSGHRAWHHELLDGPLQLGPHETAEIDGPAARGRFVVSIAWTTSLEGGGTHRERRMATVEPTSS